MMIVVVVHGPAICRVGPLFGTQTESGFVHDARRPAGTRSSTARLGRGPCQPADATTGSRLSAHAQACQPVPKIELQGLSHVTCPSPMPISGGRFIMARTTVLARPEATDQGAARVQLRQVWAFCRPLLSLACARFLARATA
jgi:hypothetical protein